MKITGTQVFNVVGTVSMIAYIGILLNNLLFDGDMSNGALIAMGAAQIPIYCEIAEGNKKKKLKKEQIKE